MKTDDGDFPDDLTEVEGWLQATQEKLYERWHGTTGHRPGASNGTWACRIARHCRTCNEHLSLPCSLLMEANEIAGFLNTPCYADSPQVFLRLYLIVLSEFVSQLHDVAALVGVQVGKPPSVVMVWANRWAKHRLHFLVQHHPQFIFADSFEEDWGKIAAKLPTCTAVDRCGEEHPLTVIDYEWLRQAIGKQPSLDDANDERQAVVAVPPLMSFLEPTIQYFREFIDTCLKSPELVRRFESSHFTLRC